MLNFDPILVRIHLESAAAVNSASSDSGSAAIRSGSTRVGPSGHVEVKTGRSLGASAGSIAITTGDSAVDAAGDLVVSGGRALDGTGGSVWLQSGSVSGSLNAAKKRKENKGTKRSLFDLAHEKAQSLFRRRHQFAKSGDVAVQSGASLSLKASGTGGTGRVVLSSGNTTGKLSGSIMLESGDSISLCDNLKLGHC